VEFNNRDGRKLVGALRVMNANWKEKPRVIGLLMVFQSETSPELEIFYCDSIMFVQGIQRLRVVQSIL